MRIARGISVTNTSKPISSAIVYDADAAAFFTAASITDNTQKSAVNTLVLSLKSANIWTKMKALYPVVGGVASAHAVNLKTPGTYNLSFATGWTHASTGMTPLNAYADSALIQDSNLSNYNSHLSYYSRTNDLSDSWNDTGGQDDFSGGVRQFYIKYASTFVYSNQNNDANRIRPTDTNTLGFAMVSRTSQTSMKAYRNASIAGSNTNSTSATQMLISTTFGAWKYRNSGGSISYFYGNKQCAFASIGDGLTDAEALSFYNAVQTMQTTLGRQV